MYLIDTNVISELRRVRPHQAVVAWLDGVAEHDLFVAAVTIGELQAGVEIMRDQDPDKAREIEAWVEQVAMTYNVVAMDSAIFRRWAKLMHHRSDELIEDAMIAATAQTHGLTVVTRNIKDFRQLGVATLNPFDV
jgi:predicted nucleic acid-binding protein